MVPRDVGRNIDNSPGQVLLALVKIEDTQAFNVFIEVIFFDDKVG